MDTFTTAYIECALWSTTDQSDERGGEPLDANYHSDDLSPLALATILNDCARFQHVNADDLADADPAQAGHDFWLNRNGHGAGFWDGDWPEPQASRLDLSSKSFGECDLYVGDDGKLYL